MAGHDTIAALATPPGVSALAVVRLSGPEAVSIARRLCPSLPDSPEPRRALLLDARDPATGEGLDRVLVTVFPEPGSYTGEDLVEISGHGGWLTPSLIVEACLGSGARMAERGEFTRRAYLNGKLDLLQVEAVLDLIEGRSRALRGVAIHQMERGLSRRIDRLRDALVELEALLVHYVDFPEEDDPPVPLEQITEKGQALEEIMEELLRTAPEGELLREGALTVLAGRPNSGKSSLFNALIGEERAIVTEDPGTTRDALEAVVSLGGFPFRLVDTAGLRDSEETVERLGIEVARRYLEAADVILFCSEGEPGLDSGERRFLRGVEETPVVLVRTKADLREDGDGAGGRKKPGGPRFAVGPGGDAPESLRGVVDVSVRTGAGLAELSQLLPDLLFAGLVRGGCEAPVLTRRRQAEGVARALAEVSAFRRAIENGDPVEIASTHLRTAEGALVGVLGIIPEEDVLDRVFREFCIGK